jgi:UPF0288 family protein (methanogenesis marker protein 3)
MRTAEDAKIAREVLSHYESHPKGGKYFRKYLKMIDKRVGAGR